MNKKKLFFALPLFFILFTSQAQHLVINEILASNNNANTDEDGDHQDWLELFNGTAESVSLNGYGLTDNTAQPFKWVFPHYVIAPGEHLLVWCSDKNRTNPALPLHTNWKISNEGETIRLSDASGAIVDEIPPVVLGADVSYGRTPSGGSDFIIFVTPTPGAPNSELPPLETLSPPVLSVASGFFDHPFELSITHTDPGVAIIYTIDGSEPKEENIGGKTYSYKNQYPEFPESPSGVLLQNSITTWAYQSPIVIADRSGEPNKVSAISTTYHENPNYIPSFTVQKSTVIRARAIKDGADPSPTVTRNYFIGPNGFSVPVVSINLDEDVFFGYENGIHVAGKDFDDWRTANPTAAAAESQGNYTRSGDWTEVHADFAYFKNGTEQLSQQVGIRINGGFTRSYPNKSLRIYARSEYGNNTLACPFFDDMADANFKTLILRNSGNDGVQTYFRDAMIQRISSHLHFDTQSYQPTVTFLNGEYWGMLNLRERYDKHFFKRVYDVNDNELDYLELDGLVVEEGDNNHYLAMLGYLENHSLADQASFDYIKTQLDPENFTDYFIANIYANNTDWPHNNIEFWRKRTDSYQPNAAYGHDGRWRWLMKDTDSGFAGVVPNDYEFDMLAFTSSDGSNPNMSPAWATFIFRKLLENEPFRIGFINRFADLMNTAYLPERVNGIIAQMKTNIENEAGQHGARWNTLQNWQTEIDKMVTFSNLRAPYQRSHIREKFGIESNVNVTLNVGSAEHGHIDINTISLTPDTPGVPQNTYPWNGIYFKNVPVTLKAVAKEGYAFSYWSGSIHSDNPEITVVPDGDFSLTAYFVPLEINERIPVYFWALDSSLPNLSLLTSIHASFEQTGDATMHYTSCLDGYPFEIGHPDWGRAALTKIDNPTNINYLPEANYGVDYFDAGIRGIMVTQPLHSANGESALSFHLPTDGYRNIVVSFAAKNMNAAEALVLDYSVDPDGDRWIREGLLFDTLPLQNDYTLYAADFTAIGAINDNPDFKIRLRFAGSDMTAINGGRVYFNNVSLIGSPMMTMGIREKQALDFAVYPNPFSDVVQVKHHFDQATYSVLTIDGRMVKSGRLSAEVDLSELARGIYLLQVSAEGKTQTKKLLKK